MKRWLSCGLAGLLVGLAACPPPAQEADRPAPTPAPTRAATTPAELPCSGADPPLYPAAQPLPEQTVATTMSPGMNMRRDVFQVAAGFAQVVAYYERCLGQVKDRADQTVRFALPLDQQVRADFPEASRTLAIEPAPDGQGSRILITCDGCY